MYLLCGHNTYSPNLLGENLLQDSLPTSETVPHDITS